MKVFMIIAILFMVAEIIAIVVGQVDLHSPLGDALEGGLS
jgi:hypothetical protein